MTSRDLETIGADTEGRRISRRALLLGSLSLGLGGLFAAGVALILDFLTPRGIEGPGAVVRAGSHRQYPVGSKTFFEDGHFWLVHLTKEQGGPGFIALEASCTHLGCTIPWRETFSFHDARTGSSRQGWFRCPCHAATFDHAGERVFGPAPRALDRFEVMITGGGSIRVHTGKLRKGAQDNARHAVNFP